MSKKRRSGRPDGRPNGRHKNGDFPNYWKEVSSTDWRQFPTCTFEEFFTNRVFKWKLISNVQAIMRLYYPSGSIREFAIRHGDDINHTIQSVLNYDPDIRIFIVNPMQQMFIYSTDSDGDGPSPSKNPVPI